MPLRRKLPVDHLSVRDGLRLNAGFSELKKEVAKLSLDTLGYVLFRCEGEEQAQFGTGAYDIPGFGKTVYCGLQGQSVCYPHLRVEQYHVMNSVSKWDGPVRSVSYDGGFGVGYDEVSTVC